ncbi:ZPR1 zinc finger domain-containing protein [Candidatus Woesearchaeota archaeon]|nr:ZPR1 zinc finger domain-containing protein [Candidatus Woesearchaeota archaeon]
MVEILKNQECPICRAKTLELREDTQDVPGFGRTYIFSMSCSSCKFHQADVEAEEHKEPAKYCLDINSEEDMKIRVIKSSEATVKLVRIADITPGQGSDGYITNVEGILERIKEQVENVKDSEDDDDIAQNARKLIKKLNRIIWGREKAKLIIEDPSGNSAIISDKAVVSKLK